MQEKTTLIRIESENGSRIVRMSKRDADKCERLLQGEEWNDKVNTILDRAEPVPLYATINTMGDGYGFYKHE